MRWRACVLLAAGLARAALADPLWVSGIEAVDATAGTSRATLELTEVGTAASTTAYPVTQNQSAIGIVHNQNNGGSSTSQWGKLYEPATTLTRFDTVPVSPRELLLCASIALHVDSIPAAADVLVFQDTTGSQAGCGVRLNTDRTFTPWYRSAATTSWAATAQRAEINHCSGDPLIECTTGTDCPSGTCTSCASNMATGTGCYFAGLEMCESVQGGVATCELRLDGAVVAKNSTVPAIAPVGVGEVQFGIVAKAATSSPRIQIDDVVINDGARAGFGYVEKLAPDGSDGARTWSKNSCGGTGPQHYPCLDRFQTTPWEYHAASFLSVSSGDQQEAMTSMTPLSALPTGAKVDAVETLIFGRSVNTSAATREITVHTLRCPTGISCVVADTSPLIVVAATTNERLLGRRIALKSVTPDGATPETWSAANAAQLGFRMTTSAASTGGIRVVEALQYVFVRRQDAGTPITIADRNIGVNDGIKVFASSGDSLNGATASAVCSGGSNDGEYCTSGVTHYCSWDSIDRDEPNCLGINANCQVCTGRRSENGGSGYICTADAQCPVSGATCNTGTGLCSANTAVPCAIDADCNNLGGSCETTATCVEACPGGSCPGHGGWGANVQGLIAADIILVCSVGGETSQYNVSNRLLITMQGEDGYCSAIQGTGQCGCTSGADCDSGTCTSGRCVGGADGACQDNLGCKTCTLDSHCGTGAYCREGRCACRFPPVDALAMLEGVNDTLEVPAAECNEVDAVRAPLYDNGGLCDACASTPCINDTTCTSAIGQGSWCAGYNATVGPDDPCVANSTGVQCTAAITPCRVSSDCPAGLSQTCSVNLPTAVGKPGRCQCAADGNCPAGYTCEGSICRNDCTTADSQCVTQGTPFTGVCDTAADACKGRCTCPCEATPCTTAADCEIRTGIVNPLGPTWTNRGECVAGRCRGCGFALCVNDPSTAYTRSQTIPQAMSRHFGLQYQTAQAAADLFGGSDGGPLIIAGMHPRYYGNKDEGCGPFTWAHPVILESGNWWVRNNMPYVFDLGPAFDRRPVQTTYTAIVHFQDPANILAGEILAERVNALNTCAAGMCLLPGQEVGPACGADADCTGGATCYLAQATPSRYCRNANGTWDASADPCSATDPCTAPETCELRPCRCTCTTTKDCQDWFGASAACTGSPLRCTIAAADACTTVYGASYTCDTTSKKCETTGNADICTATLDVCAPT